MKRNLYIFRPGDGAGHPYPETFEVRSTSKEKAEKNIRRRYSGYVDWYYVGMRYAE